MNDNSLIYLVKPHPPAEILNRKTPVAEAFKYNWEPLVLKLAAYFIDRSGPGFRNEIWHLFDLEDDSVFLEAAKDHKPAFIVFSEIDILVNEVNRLAECCRELPESPVIIVCGKQSSLLREGDKLPFSAADYVLGGDSLEILPFLLHQLAQGKRPEGMPGLLSWDSNGIVTGYEPNNSRTELNHIDGTVLRTIPVVNHSFSEYLHDQQKHPALLSGEIVTAPFFSGTGCPYQCSVCQSPVEYGSGSGQLCFREPAALAEELAFLIKKRGVNNIFSLEPNLHLAFLEKIYGSLEEHGISYLSYSGFIRAADVVRAAASGLLKRLAAKGLRVLSIGLDIPLDSRDDVYNKQFSYDEMMRCLEVCREEGILVLGTLVGDPDLTALEFEKILQRIGSLPVAAVDIRLAMALRNTEYFFKVQEFLTEHPDSSHAYFDRQNYRYQTILMPGKIRPEQSYELLRNFQNEFLITDSHIAYVSDMVNRHQDTAVFFRDQYSGLKETPEFRKIRAEFITMLYNGE